MIRLGAIDSPPKTPCILGVECAGEIEAVGEGVTDFAVGDRVVALPEFKAWAELAAVPEKYVFKVPDELSFADATAITLPFVVAHILVYDLANVQPGRSVLVHSAGGSVVSNFRHIHSINQSFGTEHTSAFIGLSNTMKITLKSHSILTVFHCNGGVYVGVLYCVFHHLRPFYYISSRISSI